MEIQINKDIRKYKAKDVGMFSFKEAGFIAGGLLAGGAVSIICTQVFHFSFRTEMLAFPAVPFILVGFAKPFGLPILVFLNQKKKHAKRFLPWKTNFVYDLSEFGQLYGEEYAYSEEELSAMSDKSQIQKKSKKEKRNEKSND